MFLGFSKSSIMSSAIVIGLFLSSFPDLDSFYFSFFSDCCTLDFFLLLKIELLENFYLHMKLTLYHFHFTEADTSIRGLE